MSFVGDEEFLLRHGWRIYLTVLIIAIALLVVSMIIHNGLFMEIHSTPCSSRVVFVPLNKDVIIYGATANYVNDWLLYILYMSTEISMMTGFIIAVISLYALVKILVKLVKKVND